MGEVVGFFPAGTEEKLWQCSCDCFTFNMRHDGNIRCANCGKISDAYGESGRWRSKLPDTVQPEKPTDSKSETNVVDFGSDKIAIEGVLRKALDKRSQLIAVLAIFDNGACTSWTDNLERRQHEWLKRQIDLFLSDMIVYHKIDMTAPLDAEEAKPNGDQGPA